MINTPQKNMCKLITEYIFADVYNNLPRKGVIQKTKKKLKREITFEWPAES